MSTPSTSALRLIIHAPTEAALKRARNNALNMQAAVPDAEIELVINGPAVAAALASPHETDALLRVCRNSLAKLNQTCPAHLQSVAAAVVHIAERQRDGWAYMRA